MFAKANISSLEKMERRKERKIHRFRGSLAKSRNKFESSREIAFAQTDVNVSRRHGVLEFRTRQVFTRRGITNVEWPACPRAGTSRVWTRGYCLIYGDFPVYIEKKCMFKAEPQGGKTGGRGNPKGNRS